MIRNPKATRFLRVRTGQADARSFLADKAARRRRQAAASGT